ncbi:sensor histidine kinase [Scopulibacillus cellulosilyticus]|uniref:histidine kinase n=1 Tax=Scopulibacillus cellulosilyticus TaxID=2665665 RepID=A0ABW2PZ03_9BACL
MQPRTEAIRKLTGAGYVVVGNKSGIRYSANKEYEIGKEMGTSNNPVFSHGKSVIYEGTGVSGPAIKAKTPIYNDKGKIIGVSSVGFLLNDVDKSLIQYNLEIFGISVLILAAGIIGAMTIARRVKRLIFGLEPEEISFLFKEREATLESIRDAIVAVDLDERIKSMNKKARRILKEKGLTIGGQIQSPRLRKILNNVVQSNKGQKNQRVLLGNQVYIIDCSPIVQDTDVKGAVLTLRTESEIEFMLDEVSKIKVFSENARAQNHEYLNRLNTIFGLLQLEKYEMAKSLIADEIKDRQDIIAFLMSSVKDPLISACLLGKVNRAKELKVQLQIDPDSNLTNIPASIDNRSIVTILGNIIDNAMEAARVKNGSKGIVKVSFTDLGRDLIFDIEDNGPGIPKELESMIFENGYTTKTGENHGLGLAIVKNIIKLLNGQIFIDKSQLGGSRFSIVIPL